MTFDQFMHLATAVVVPLAITGAVVFVAVLLKTQIGRMAERMTKLKVGDKEVQLGVGEDIIRHDPPVARAYTDKIVYMSSSIEETRQRVVETMMVAGEEGVQQYMSKVETDAIDYASTLQDEDAKVFLAENDVAMARIEPTIYRAVKRAMADNNIPQAEDQAFVDYVKMKALTLDGIGMKIRRMVVWNRALHDKFLAFSRGRDQEYMQILSAMFGRAAKDEAEIIAKIEKNRKHLEALADHYVATAKIQEACQDQ